jgi:hypothetical protein
MRIFLAVMMVAASTSFVVAGETTTTAPAALQAPAPQGEALQSPAIDTAVEQSYSGYSRDCGNGVRKPTTVELLMN